MKLKLTKPIVFFDIEATGLSVTNDRIVEISILKIFPDEHEESVTYRVNPEKHIPKDISEIHGIYDDDVKDKPTFKQIAQTIANIVEGSDLGGFNSNKFDIPLLAEEFIRAGIQIDLHKRRFIDVQNIYHKMERRNLEAAYKFYCHKDLANAHSAFADIKATYEVLQAQLDKYSDTLQNDVDFLAEFSSRGKAVDFASRMAIDNQGRVIFNFGKHNGEPVEKVFETDKAYYKWIMKNDFPEDTKRILTELKLNALNNKEE